MAKQSGVKTSKLEELENSLGDALCQAGLAKKSYPGRGKVQPVYQEWEGKNLYQLLQAKFKSPSPTANFSPLQQDSFRRLNKELDNPSYGQIIEILDSNREIDSELYPMLSLLKSAKNDAERELRSTNERITRDSPPLATPPKDWQNFASRVLALGKKEEKVSKAVSGWDAFADGLLSNLSRVKEIFTSEEEKRKIKAEEEKRRQEEEFKKKERQEIDKEGSFLRERKAPEKPQLNVVTQDRGYTFICKIEKENQLSSDNLLSNPKHYLSQRKAMWNKYLIQFDIEDNKSKSRDNKSKSRDKKSNLGQETLSYIQFLKTNIEKLKPKNDNAKILSGFLQLELKKIEYMFLGEKIIPEYDGPRPFREPESIIYKDPQRRWLSPEMNDAYKAIKGVGANIAHYTGIDRISGVIGQEIYEYDIRDSSPLWHSQSVVSDKMYKAKYKVKSKMFSKISKESQETILQYRYLVGEIKALGEDERKFLDRIELPNRIPDELTPEYKAIIQQELSSKIGRSSHSIARLEKANSLPDLGAGSSPSEMELSAQMRKSTIFSATPSNSPKPYQSDEVRNMLKNIRSEIILSSNLVNAVDGGLDLSGGMFERASKIDKAIGVMDRNNPSQENSLVQELKDYKKSFEFDSRDSGFIFKKSGPNAYAYIRFLGSRIELLQKVSDCLKSQSTASRESHSFAAMARGGKDQDQLKSIKEMQANLLLELARFEVGLTPECNFYHAEFMGFEQKTLTSSRSSSNGPVHAEYQVKSVKRRMKEEILGSFKNQISSDRLDKNHSFIYNVLVSNPAKNPVKKELEAVIKKSRLLMGISSLKTRNH